MKRRMVQSDESFLAEKLMNAMKCFIYPFFMREAESQ